MQLARHATRLVEAEVCSCETCNLSYFACPGHYGHIDLPVPVYQPLFMSQMFHVFRGVCLFCHHFKMPEMLVCPYLLHLFSTSGVSS